jgi:hypothetical protein
MSIGPIQIILVGFDRIDQFKGEVLEQLTSLRGRGMIRVIDLFMAIKDPSGDVAVKELNDLNKEESAEFGQVISKLIGVTEVKEGEENAEVMENLLAAASHSVGLDYKGIKKMVDTLPPGKAFGIIMIEHTWAISLRDAVRKAGGVPLAQGFVTPEALAMVGKELQAIAEAERTIEVAQIVQGAAILDTLATLEAAEEMKTAIAADVLRTLVVADLIEEAAVNEAIEALAAANLLEAEALERAKKVDAEEASEDKELMSGEE